MLARKIIYPLFVVVTTLFFTTNINTAHADYIGWYGSSLCDDFNHYNCVSFGKMVVERKVNTKKGPQTIKTLVDPDWEDAFPDEGERLLIMKINRMNHKLRAGDRIAVPKDMRGKTLMDLSPFPGRIESHDEPVLIFDPARYGWAAYDENGKLVRWGPAVGGKGGFWTPAGTFRIYSKGDAGCRSKQYPDGCRGKGCTPMPYCMSFRRGYAFHAGDLPGRHESHGCVRLFYDDAKWLNQSFATFGTKVVIKPYY